MNETEYISKMRREIPEAKNFSYAELKLHYEMVYKTANMRDYYNNQDLWIAIMKHKREEVLN